MKSFKDYFNMVRNQKNLGVDQKIESFNNFLKYSLKEVRDFIYSSKDPKDHENLQDIENYISDSEINAKVRNLINNEKNIYYYIKISKNGKDVLPNFILNLNDNDNKEYEEIDELDVDTEYQLEESFGDLMVTIGYIIAR